MLVGFWPLVLTFLVLISSLFKFKSLPHIVSFECKAVFYNFYINKVSGTFKVRFKNKALKENDHRG